MIQRITRNVFTLFAAALVSATLAVGQSSTPKIEIPIDRHDSWQAAQLTGPSRGKIIVVTIDQPRRRHTCHIQSFAPDKLVCSSAFGHPRTYLSQQVLALIPPGSDESTRLVVLGLNVGLGTAIWGTVVLAATCPACAVGTGIAALICFGFAGAILMTDDQTDHLLYLAPGQDLSRKLGRITHPAL